MNGGQRDDDRLDPQADAKVGERTNPGNPALIALAPKMQGLNRRAALKYTPIVGRLVRSVVQVSVASPLSLHRG
jgi:hypothetical protein